MVRSAAIQQILSQPRLGLRPTLQVILDLTTLEKAGKFREFKGLIRVYNGKRGQHERNALPGSGVMASPLGFSSLSRKRYSLSSSTEITSNPTTAENFDWTL